ncbi:MAG: 2,3,4,5-tetrahydropyridine-2,6-dicarboxylate N-succinyltransferase, partial [Alphaproteobacteria bacterium]|nr:2,3,4,5-tetrahydropyridine-2,6-dicarboxylate N-succinyltransferase [Alphaproteobacteria bacterium]
MDTARLQATIDAAWDARDRFDAKTKAAARKAVIAALDGLDAGTLRVARKHDGRWHVEEWLKKAVLLSFRLTDM